MALESCKPKINLVAAKLPIILGYNKTYSEQFVGMATACFRWTHLLWFKNLKEYVWVKFILLKPLVTLIADWVATAKFHILYFTCKASLLFQDLPVMCCSHESNHTLSKKQSDKLLSTSYQEKVICCQLYFIDFYAFMITFWG